MKFDLFLILLITTTNQLVKQIKKKAPLHLTQKPHPYLHQELQTHLPRSLHSTPEISQDQTNTDISSQMLYAGIGEQPLEFSQNLHTLEKDLDEHRKHSVSIISSEMKAAAISVYIANSVLVMKMGSGGYSERVLLPFKEGLEGLRVVYNGERRLLGRQKGQKERLGRERDLLESARKGELFDFDLDEVYDVKRETVEKFKKEIGDSEVNI